jgi:uncharacterized protein (TIGR02246 family)
MKLRIAILVAASALVGMAGCTASDRSTDAEAAIIEDMHGRWADAEVAKDLEMTLSFLGEGAVLQPPGQSPVQGPDALRSFYEGFFAAPLTSMTMHSTHVDVSESGDLAYIVGALDLVMETDDGPASIQFKFLAVYKKQDGEWKVVANSWSSNT